MTFNSTLMERFSLYLKTCTKGWILVYVFLCIPTSLTSLKFHMMMIGVLLCLISYFRLPPPDPVAAFIILGPDPTNYDGSPNERVGNQDLGIIGHRAACLDAPENSIIAVRMAKKNGAKCVEFDIAFTRDDVAVVFHDETVDRVTDGTGRLDELSFAEVRELDLTAKHVHKELFKSPERIPTVEEFVEECLNLDMKMILDLKGYDRPERTVELVLQLFKTYPQMYQSTIVGSFSPHDIYQIRSRDPNIICAMIWCPHFIAYEDYTPGPSLKNMIRKFASQYKQSLAELGDVILCWSFHEFLWYFLGIAAVLIHKDVLTPDYVQQWHDRGIRVIAWTVNDPIHRAHLLTNMGVPTISDTMEEIPLHRILQQGLPTNVPEEDAQTVF